MVYLFIMATLCCLMGPVASFIIKTLTTWCFPQTSENLELRKNLIALKKEMNSISMVDEFAKYAKLQRKYNKLEAEVKEQINSRSTAISKLQFFFTTAVKVLNGIMTSVLLYLYRKEPVIILPSGTLWPLGFLLSWPTTIDSCISLPIWIMLLKLTVSKVNSYFKVPT